jgi:hypothetical protein
MPFSSKPADEPAASRRCEKTYLIKVATVGSSSKLLYQPQQPSQATTSKSRKSIEVDVTAPLTRNTKELLFLRSYGA